MKKPLIFVRKILVKALIVFTLVEMTTYGWTNNATENESQGRSEEKLKETVYYLSRTVGVRNYVYHDNLNTAAQYIITKFKSYGYNVSLDTYQIEGKDYHNIVAEIPNSKSLQIIIGAHYDSCFNPGADDNATGIAGLLELARSLKTEEVKAQIKFVAFVNEEPPFFKTDKMGSYVYASRSRKRKDDIRAVIILEMLGYYSEKRNSQRYPPILGMFYPNKANFIAVIGNKQSRLIVNAVKTSFKKRTSFSIQSLIAPKFISVASFSDNWSFWKKGFPAIMVTDTAFLRNRNYHLKTDIIETLNFDKANCNSNCDKI